MQTGSPQTGIIKTLPPSTPWCEVCTLSPVPILQPITSAGRKQHQKQGMRCRGSGKMHMVLLPFPHAGASSLLSISSPTRAPPPLQSLLSAALRVHQHSGHHAATACHSASKLAYLKVIHVGYCYATVIPHSAKEWDSNLHGRKPSALPPTPYHDAGQSLPSHCLRSPTGITGN